MLGAGRVLATALVLMLGLFGGPGWAAAESPVASSSGPAVIAVRGGDHPGFGRLVLDLPPGDTAEMVPAEGGLTIRATSGASARLGFGALPRTPRNVRGLGIEGGALRIAVAPGVTIRQTRMSGKLVLDFLDARAAKATIAVPLPSGDSRPAPPRHPDAPPAASVLGSAKPDPLPAQATPPKEPVSSAPPPIVAVAAVPAPVEATPLPPPAAPVPEPEPVKPVVTRFVLPIPAGAGLAALRRGDVGMLVADAATPADPAAWRAIPPLADATIVALPGATLVSFKPPPGSAPVITHGPDGWTLDLSPKDPAAATQDAPGIALAMDPPRLVLGVTGASRVVSVADPLGGGLLLIGTILPNALPTAARAGRVLPAFSLLPTWRGVAVEPMSDALDMRALASGFVLDPGPQRGLFGDLAQGGAARADSEGFSRVFDLPPLPIASLVNRQAAAAGAVSSAPPRGRGLAQLRLAETMVALGLGAEAQAVLRLAVAADGRLAVDPKALALSGVAAVLAGRLPESGGLEDAAVVADATGTDEIAFWRAIRAAALSASADTPPPPEAARTLAGRLPILASYPEPLRRRLSPLVAETLVEGGAVHAVERFLAASGAMPGLDYAKALLDERSGRPDAALGRLDRLASQPDRRDRARAAVRAVELRLAAKKLTEAQAADALDRLIVAWRGDARELAVRLRVAELRARAGQFRAALAMLRETRDLGATGAWTEAERDDVQARMGAVFAETLAHDDAKPLEPLEFVSLIEDNADLLPSGPAGERVAARVADRLAALDLPERAAAALRKLMEAAPKGSARAALGARLAATQLAQNDPPGALMTLSDSTAEALPPALVADRTLIYARATALRGNVDAATGALAALDTQAAETLRIELLEKAARWPDATAALARRVARALPADGPITPELAAWVLRLASAAAQASDDSTLDQIRTDLLPRMPAGESADMLRVLTARPVGAVSDLPRAAQEAALARSVTR